MKLTNILIILLIIVIIMSFYSIKQSINSDLYTLCQVQRQIALDNPNTTPIGQSALDNIYCTPSVFGIKSIK